MSLTTSLRVAAFRQYCEARGASVYILRKGEPSAGAVVVRVARSMRESEVLVRQYGLDGADEWVSATGVVPDMDADSYLERRYRSDDDLWAVEVEWAEGMPPLEALATD